MRWKRRRHRKQMRKLRKFVNSPDFIAITVRFNQAMDDSRGLLQEMFDRIRELDGDIKSYMSELAAQSVHES